jgi:hypothetical protein
MNVYQFLIDNASSIISFIGGLILQFLNSKRINNQRRIDGVLQDEKYKILKAKGKI